MDKELKSYMANVDECIALFKDKVTRLEKEKQAAEQRAERAEKALRDIANPIPYLQKKAEEEGGVLNGFVFQVASDPSFLKSIAVDALTPKQAGDERRL